MVNGSPDWWTIEAVALRCQPTKRCISAPTTAFFPMQDSLRGRKHGWSGESVSIIWSDEHLLERLAHACDLVLRRIGRKYCLHCQYWQPKNHDCTGRGGSWGLALDGSAGPPIGLGALRVRVGASVRSPPRAELPKVRRIDAARRRSRISGVGRQPNDGSRPQADIGAGQTSVLTGPPVKAQLATRDDSSIEA